MEGKVIGGFRNETGDYVAYIKFPSGEIKVEVGETRSEGKDFWLDGEARDMAVYWYERGGQYSQELDEIEAAIAKLESRKAEILKLKRVA